MSPSTSNEIIDRDIICSAWLNAHFSQPNELNPLLHGLAGHSPSPLPPRIHRDSSPHSPSSSTVESCPLAVEHGLPPLLSAFSPHSTHSFFDRASVRGLGGTWTGSNDHPVNSGGGNRGLDCGGLGFSHSVHASLSNQASPSDTRDKDDTGEQAYDNDDDDDSAATAILVSNTVQNQFANSVRTIPLSEPSKKRKAGANSHASQTKSETSVATDNYRKKRLQLALCDPSGRFGIPDPDPDPDPTDDREDVFLPPHLIAFLAHFSPGKIERACVPQSPEIDAILAKTYPHEAIEPYNRLDVTGEAAIAVGGLNLFNFIIRIHRACLKNSRVAEDESAWYPVVAELLSVDPPRPTETVSIASPPSASGVSKKDLFTTVNATTKTTVTSLHPAGTNVKLDYLICFNSDHRTIRSTAERTWAAQIPLNAFNDTVIRNTIVVVGVEVKAAQTGILDAEYQLGVWGMKTLDRMRCFSGVLAGRTQLAIGVSVCAHVWSFHVTYWRNGKEMVTHGPVVVGHTDTVYGTCKVVAFVARLKAWARDELWGEWEALLAAPSS
ncbi:hypothetical protein Q9L58_010385 [Maublancomyces gigas]|uniref:PD-(D/E)XK nuclease-like domain-containing protein n=1 Tax=Discina gigas TaxID=1032678 RepID=A0ABR3G4A7_9PEZI